MNIREATEKDFEKIWPIFHEIVSLGETYAYSRNTTKNEALKIWLTAPKKTFVFEENNQITCRYYFQRNSSFCSLVHPIFQQPGEPDGARPPCGRQRCL